jgi:flagellar hook-associated protein 2
MSTSPVTSPQTTLTGSSTFASDLQTSLTRAVAIASLPMQLLQADQSQLTSKAGELGQLSSLFGAVQNSLQSLASGTSSGALAASVSDSSIVEANLTGSPLPGTYTVDVLNPGSAASAISAATSTPVTDPSAQDISQSTSFTLTAGGKTFTIQPVAQNLNALASAINSSGAPVQAIVVNLGTPAAADYRLVLQGSSLGNSAIQLNDGQTGLLTALSAGSNASYTVDGQPPGGITTSSSTVTIAPGLNVTLEKGGIANVTVSASLNSVSNALSSFVSAYNAAITELQKNRGQGGGALTGDGTVLSMQQALSQIANYTGSSGSITSLTQLGVEFTSTGSLTFDPTAVSNLTQSQITDALSFLGDPNSSGFLQFATKTLNGFTDPTNGVIATEAQAWQAQSTQDQQEINSAQARITQLQANLQAQMAKADALIATLQQQNTFLQGLFQFNTTTNPNGTSAG